MTNPIKSAAPLLNGRLSPGAEDLLRSFRANGFQSWSALGLEAGRAFIREINALAGPPEPVARVESIRVPGPEPSGVAAKLYRPECSARLPVMLYLHGGGWVLGDHTAVDGVVRMLVNRSGCAVLSMDYALAPEQKYPAALEDVRHGLEWLVANADEWGLDPGRLAVGGDSSGANLAAATSLFCRDQGGPPLTLQLLVYPALDHDYQTVSYERFGDGISSALSREDVVWFHRHYVNHPEELPQVSPLRAESFSRLPRTLLIAAGIDPLFDDSIEFAQRLEGAGVPVELEIYPGMFHGFWRMPGVLAEARQAIDFAAGKLRQAMGCRSEKMP